MNIKDNLASFVAGAVGTVGIAIAIGIGIGVGAGTVGIAAAITDAVVTIFSAGAIVTIFVAGADEFKPSACIAGLLTTVGLGFAVANSYEPQINQDITFIPEADTVQIVQNEDNTVNSLTSLGASFAAKVSLNEDMTVLEYHAVPAAAISKLEMA